MTLADEINRMIKTVLESSTWTSAGGKNPVDDFIKEFRGVENPDLEAMISGDEGADPEIVQKNIDIDTSVKQVKVFKKGQVGEINRMTSGQFGNIRALAQNPTKFFIGTILTKFAKGAGIAALALILFEVVKFVIAEMLKPGRFLDIRFRRDIVGEILAFRSREDKQKLLVGTASIIVTTIGGLRGGEGQISSNLRALGGLQVQPLPRDFKIQAQVSQASGEDLTAAKGKRTRFRA